MLWFWCFYFGPFVSSQRQPSSLAEDFRIQLARQRAMGQARMSNRHVTILASKFHTTNFRKNVRMTNYDQLSTAPQIRFISNRPLLGMLLKLGWQSGPPKGSNAGGEQAGWRNCIDYLHDFGHPVWSKSPMRMETDLKSKSHPDQLFAWQHQSDIARALHEEFLSGEWASLEVFGHLNWDISVSWSAEPVDVELIQHI